MRPTLPWLLLLAAAATPALDAAPAAPAAGPASELTIHFEPLDPGAAGVPGGDAFIDFGTVTARPGAGHGRGILIRRRVAVRLDGPAWAPASARLSVALTADTPGCTVRVDGVTLSTFPRTIDPVHRVGTAVVHEIEVTIPASAPPGIFLGDLEWLAESE
jgi:hypothetical protein